MKQKLSFEVVGRTGLSAIKGGGMSVAASGCFSVFPCSNQGFFADQYCRNQNPGSQGCRCGVLPNTGPRYCGYF